MRESIIYLVVGFAIGWVGMSAVAAYKYDKPMLQCVISQKPFCE